MQQQSLQIYLLLLLDQAEEDQTQEEIGLILNPEEVILLIKTQDQLTGIWKTDQETRIRTIDQQTESRIRNLEKEVRINKGPTAETALLVLHILGSKSTDSMPYQYCQIQKHSSFSRSSKRNTEKKKIPDIYKLNRSQSVNKTLHKSYFIKGQNSERFSDWRTQKKN